jgi:hypothetical protein
VRPELIVETGTNLGGSALFLASIRDLLGQGEVVTIDVDRQEVRPRHPRIAYLTGSSTAAAVVRQVRQRAASKSPVLDILDSSHARKHVLTELETYTPRVTPGSYHIVEDTNFNGHPVEPRHGPGPAEAVAAFLASDGAFARDERGENLQSGRIPAEDASDGQRHAEVSVSSRPPVLAHLPYAVILAYCGESRRHERQSTRHRSGPCRRLRSRALCAADDARQRPRCEQRPNSPASSVDGVILST